MHQIRFTNWHMDNDTLLLKGNFFSAKVQLYQGNVWRIFSWHRPEDENKKSWVLSLNRPEPFTVQPETGGLRLIAADTDDLQVRLDPFSWSWGTINFMGLDTHALTSVAGDTSDMDELATGFGNPTVEVNDGYPIGCGISLGILESSERKYYGLGERTGYLNKKGRRWTNWASDILEYKSDQDPLYQAHPFVMGLENGTCFGLYLDETWETVFDLANSEPDRSYISTKGPTFDIYLIAGPKPKDVIRTFATLSGRPELPPLWAFGMHQSRWSYPDDRTVLSIADQYRERKIPLDAIWLDIDYMDGYKNFTFNPGRFPTPEKTIAKLKQDGIRTVVIVDAGVKKEDGYDLYESGKERNAFIKDRTDVELVGEVWPKPAVWPDFIQAHVRDWWADCHKFYMERGVSGIWNDMNEPSSFNFKGKTLPLGARHGRYWHAEVHNLYAYQMCRATYQGLKKLNPEYRPFVLTRSGFTGIQKYAFVWSGDNHSSWEHMEMSVPMLMNLGLSGVAFCGADIGGFSSNCDAEMLARWTWLGVFYPFMRNHSGKGSRRQEPWAFGPEIEKNVIRAIRLRYKLLPYIYTLAHEASSTGIPILRPLFLEYPDDDQTAEIYDQFLFGRDLLVAPILRPGQENRIVYLPEGQWQDFWTGNVFSGQQWIPTHAAIDKIPMFIRAAACIPMTEWAQSTTNAWWESITWNIFLSDRITGRLYEDSGDGYASSRIQKLNGIFSAGKLEIQIQNHTQKRKTMLRLMGVPEPETSDIPFSYEDDTLLLNMNRDRAIVTWRSFDQY